VRAACSEAPLKRNGEKTWRLAAPLSDAALAMIQIGAAIGLDRARQPGRYTERREHGHRGDQGLYRVMPEKPHHCERGERQNSQKSNDICARRMRHASLPPKGIHSLPRLALYMFSNDTTIRQYPNLPPFPASGGSVVSRNWLTRSACGFWRRARRADESRWALWRGGAAAPGAVWVFSRDGAERVRYLWDMTPGHPSSVSLRQCRAVNPNRNAASNSAELAETAASSGAMGSSLRMLVIRRCWLKEGISISELLILSE
jgi:hypothetical protein